MRKRVIDEEENWRCGAMDAEVVAFMLDFLCVRDSLEMRSSFGDPPRLGCAARKSGRLTTV